MFFIIALSAINNEKNATSLKFDFIIFFFGIISQKPLFSISHPPKNPIFSSFFTPKNACPVYFYFNIVKRLIYRWLKNALSSFFFDENLEVTNSIYNLAPQRKVILLFENNFMYHLKKKQFYEEIKFYANQHFHVVRLYVICSKYLCKRCAA